MAKILIACEESQTVCKAFRERGHEAYSCDLDPCSGGHPEWHLQEDVIPVMWGFEWDLVIAHPPCDYLANSGVRWRVERNEWNEIEKAAEFFNEFIMYANSMKRVCIENPIQHKYARAYIQKYNQIIQPWMFGHGEKKATCLWLFGLPKLIPTDIVEGREQRIWKLPPGPDRAKLRSKTFPGIAKAMAEQWGY